MHPRLDRSAPARQTPALEALETRRLYAAHLSSDFANHHLVSSTVHTAANLDRSLEAPHDLSLFDNETLITANTGNNSSTAFERSGAISGGSSPFDITFTDQPTSVVETDTSGFTFSQDGSSLPVGVMYGTTDGKIEGLLKANDTAVLVDDSSDNANFSGLTIGDDHLVAMLYAADEHNGRIDTYNSSYQLQSGFAFDDPTLPTGFVPVNIVFQDALLEVAYVKVDSNGQPLEKKGDGIIDAFTADGAFVHRISSGLYDPYGMAMAGSTGYGAFDNDLLIADHGTDNIYAYTFGGKYVGSVRNSAGNLVTIPGIWAVQTPSGGNDGEIYYSAQPGAHNTGNIGLLQLLKGSKYGSAG